MPSAAISDAVLASVPRRPVRKDIVVLKFGGTTVGARPEEGRIKLARECIADVVRQGRFAVPVFSAYRRGRNGSDKAFSVTDMLQDYKAHLAGCDSLADGLASFGDALLDAHLGLISDLKLDHLDELGLEVRQSIQSLTNNVAWSFSAHEDVPSLDDVIVTAGERLAVKILSAYLNEKHRVGKFPLATAPVTAMELGIYTDNKFGAATIDWPRAVDHACEVIVGQYLDRDTIPVVTGFDGIYDPHNQFKEIMQTKRSGNGRLEHDFGRVYRTSLGRGGSDLTATFLGLALKAEYVGFAKETPGVLTADDLLVGDAAQTVPELDYDLATEAGNIYSRAVEPVRAGGIPVHIFDPARPQTKTVVSDVELDAGLYIVERPIESVNIHAGTIPDEPGALVSFLRIFAERHVNVEEIRHQRSGTDFVVCGEESAIHAAVLQLNEQGLSSQAHCTWYLRVIGNVTEELATTFNKFMNVFEPLTLAHYQTGVKVLTATVVRNRAGVQFEEVQRVEKIVRRIHDQLVVATKPAVNGRRRENGGATHEHGVTGTPVPASH